jgi:AbrB family looped-hinge helix DNA binding protein
MYRAEAGEASCMGEKAVLTVSEKGRITLPVAARRALRLEPNSRVECEVVDNTIVLRKVVVVPAEDAWLYEPETAKRLVQARNRARTGRRWRLTEDFLLRLIERADDAERAGGQLTREELDRLLEQAKQSGEIEQVDVARA